MLFRTLKFLFFLFQLHIESCVYQFMYFLTKENKYLIKLSMCKFILGMNHTIKNTLKGVKNL